MADSREAMVILQRWRMEAGPGPARGRHLVKLCRGTPQGRSAAGAAEDAVRVFVVRSLLARHAAALLQLGQSITRDAHGLELLVAHI
eukprot:CAMPEP_0170626056 /NCGR_PEP_ID=MMETSP0224-20130122/31124_1 /TAXON_ID=285029 /ORGANISM="Togula jolla, Strain CCCM 725" /LENGTH=86 /DNA_ID=CAMNT_0010952743 /DNA_START=178 /DNA_END=438 /DNA_ORIENTATION=+